MTAHASDAAADSVTVRVPGKVNLGLSIGPLRDDGFHELATVYQAVSVYDDVVVRSAEQDDPAPLVTVTGSLNLDVPENAENLAWRAVEALAAHVARAPDVRVHIRKSIPVAAGMAGGSADAAAALVACDALWGTDLGRDELAQIAASVGSDVPFLIHGGTAVGTGRGEIISPALARGEFHWVFALADTGLSTPAVYRELDRLRESERRDGARKAPPPQVPEGVLAALRQGDAQALAVAMTNDLQRPALSLKPRLKLVLDAGRDHGALGALISGSGPTCAFLVRSSEAALDLAVALSATGVCRTVMRASGPVPGARVVSA